MRLAFHDDALKRHHYGFRQNDLQTAGVLGPPGDVNCSPTNIAPESFTITLGDMEAIKAAEIRETSGAIGKPEAVVTYQGVQSDGLREAFLDAGELLELSPDTIERIRPTLQLASRFLTHPVFAPFWGNLTREIWQRPTTLPNGRLNSADEVTDNLLRRRDALFDKTFKASLGPIQLFPIQVIDDRTFGVCHRSRTSKIECKYVIQLDSVYFAPILDRDRWEALSAGQRITILFDLARVITHELAHAAFRTACNGTQRSGKNEPVEMGWSWEAFAFGGEGGKFHQIECNRRFDASQHDGCTWYEARPNCVLVPVTSIQRYFTEEWWSNPSRNLIDVELTKLPMAEIRQLLDCDAGKELVRKVRRQFKQYVEQYPSLRENEALTKCLTSRFKKFIGKKHDHKVLSRFQKVNGVSFWDNTMPSTTDYIEGKKAEKKQTGTINGDIKAVKREETDPTDHQLKETNPNESQPKEPKPEKAEAKITQSKNSEPRLTQPKNGQAEPTRQKCAPPEESQPIDSLLQDMVEKLKPIS